MPLNTGWLTLPWAWSGLFLGLWAFAPTYIYHLQFVTTGDKGGVGTAEQQDLAGYIGFLAVATLMLMIGIALSVRLWHTWKLPVNWRWLAKPLWLSSALILPWYVAAIYLYENYRYSMPYDSNWAAIGGNATVGMIHYLFATFLMYSDGSDKSLTSEDMP